MGQGQKLLAGIFVASDLYIFLNCAGVSALKSLRDKSLSKLPGTAKDFLPMKVVYLGRMPCNLKFC